MAFLVHDDGDRGRGPADRTLSARLARLVLVVGLILVLLRLTAATVVTVRGNGMAPTLLDGEAILVLRGAVGVRPGDVVVYDPGPERLPASEGPDAGSGPMGPGAAGAPAGTSLPLRDTAVVDPEDMERNWQKVRARSDRTIAVVRRRALRVGRVLAVPGQTVTVGAPKAPLSLLVDGRPIVRKPGEPLSLLVPDPSGTGPPRRRVLPTAYETLGDRRYRVIPQTHPSAETFSGWDLPPPEEGPVTVTLEGYLVLADHRDEGACCDSRVLGPVPPDRIRGRVLARLLSRRGAAPDLAEGARGFAWMP